MSEFDYSVRADGKRTAVVEQVYDGTATKTTEVDWLYDDIGRLVAEVYDADTSVDGDSQFVDAAGAVINSGTAQVFPYDAYGNPHGFSLADALTTHLYSGEQTDQLTGLQYLRARYYNPATGTFNRLDPFAGNLSDPQSLHKYLYCHADAVNGIDPSGRSLSMGQLGAIGIAGLVGGIGSSAIFAETGRSAGYGFVTGFVGGASLATAFFTGRFIPVFLESAFSGVLAMVLSALIDLRLGVDPMDKIGKYATNGIEAFSWTAFNAQWMKPSDIADSTMGGDIGIWVNPGQRRYNPVVTTKGDVVEYFMSAAFIDYAQSVTHLIGALAGGFLDLLHFGAKRVVTGLTPVDKQNARAAAKDTVSNVTEIAIALIPSMLASGFISSWYGVRHWPARLEGEIMTGLADAANFGVGAGIDAIADDIADSVVDMLS